MTTVNAEVVKNIAEKVRPEMALRVRYVLRDTLRELIHIFNSLHYVNPEDKLVRIKTIYGNPERAVAKFFQENNIILPVISITESLMDNSDERRRYTPLLVHEKGWDEGQQRAVRVLSLSPRPVNVNYEINIWTEYKNDLDQVREQIFSLFNPTLEIKTRYSDITKAFLVSEDDTSEVEAADTRDRILRKAINVSVETYIPSPKFLYTNTGKIEEFHAQVELFKDNDLTKISQSEEGRVYINLEPGRDL